jgi:hypothetical protein
VTIKCAVAMGDTMTDEKMRTEESNRPEQAKPEQEHQEAPQGQASTATRQRQHLTPGRRPLFRTEGPRR